ncbi:hypothetical protein HPB47_025676 [Ixodes persulcatus]|uniref:Uncharacterized protein n=1 Tax=Ixodes persulcatus TaxID=34615 RepID=A0AC60Q2P9_IXOPE|nr:hypothetical protein HPB47_025676 [Ixodes persulcatus]
MDQHAKACRYQTVFTEVQAALKRRNQVAQECVRLEQRAERLAGRETTGPNLAKLSECKQALEAARGDLRTQGALLAQDLPRWYQASSLYLQPCLEALMHSQTLHWGQATTCAHNLLAPGAKVPVEQRLAAVRALSIVALPS